MKEKCHVIIPAAGVGKRFGGNAKKQYARLGDWTLLERAVEIFSGTGLFHKIVVVVPPLPQPSPLKGEGVSEIPPPWRGGGKGEGGVQFVSGGQTRAESVFNGFRHLNAADNDIVLIHDAVRPLASRDLVTRMIKALDACDAAVPILPVSDTVKRVRDGRVVETVDRKELGLAQTPQAFRASVLRAAYDKAEKTWNWTDEAMLIERMGGRVGVVPGEKTNIKITTPEDLKLAEAFLRVEGLPSHVCE